MNWENIDDIAKKTVVQVVTKIADEDDSKSCEEKDELVRELTEPRVLEKEMQRRGKYDGRKAFRKAWMKKRHRSIVRISAVASCLLILVGIGWMLKTKTSVREMPVPVQYGIHGNQQVILQLSGGERIALGGKDTMRLREKEQAIEVREGAIAYASESVMVDDKREELYNTLFVPKGGEFRVELSDGTVVLLNAGSELKYPLAFTGDERRVHLKGEAWFEVTKDQERPFYVTAEDVQIKVYGTSFNVNTHGTKTIQTVLEEGSIGIRSSGASQEVRVQPGQLAEYDRTGREISLREVDLRHYTAWKEGFFYFDDKTLEDIMGELSRWYDMEIIFLSDRGKALHFSGFLKRYDDVRKILATVTESTGIKFEITENKIIVN